MGPKPIYTARAPSCERTEEDNLPGMDVARVIEMRRDVRPGLQAYISPADSTCLNEATENVELSL